MILSESKLIKEYSVEEFMSGVINIAFECNMRTAFVFRNANDLFTVSIMKNGATVNEEVVRIPELANIGIGVVSQFEK